MNVIADGGKRLSNLSGLRLFSRSPVADHRGFLCRLYSTDVAAFAGLTKTIVQVNHTLTRVRGTIRGMHFQHGPRAETKVVQCIRGEIFDVAIDVRPDSPTYLHWHGEILSETNNLGLLIPEGFAHGFQTLSADCELIYLHTALYDKDSEGALNALDPVISISWPIPVSDMSERDKNHPLLPQGRRTP